jgi:hypothetical protein
METMNKLLAFVIASFGVLGSTGVHAADAPIEAGEYITEGGWGRLSIKPAKGAKLRFAIDAVGANGHTCDLSGEIRNSRAVLEGEDKAKPCVVEFYAAKNGVNVSSDECRYYCGVRAGFDALYLKPAAGCEGAARDKAEKSFKKLYGHKNYPEAKTTLEPLLKNCLKTLHSAELGSIRNDLAITMYKLGDFAGCLGVLEPYVADAKLSDEKLREDLPPADGDMLVDVVRAARTNLKLCRAGQAKK